MTERKYFNFTVASALLRELGERLVGSPALAVGELIKNAYDADATKVSVRFEDDATLVIEDNGSGMSLDEFRDLWMRVGSPHKQRERYSTVYDRPLTGSKGVGRLSVQYLGSFLELSTTSIDEPRELVVLVDWSSAVDAGDLQSAQAEYEYRDEPGRYLDLDHGFRVRISGLLHDWADDKDFEELAREVWKLQPPFGISASEEGGAFEVDLEGVSGGATERFKKIMGVLDEIWHARVLGTVVEGASKDPEGSTRIRVTWRFAEGGMGHREFVIEDFEISSLKYEIRIFDLKGKQPYGVKVNELRRYLDDHGGVRIFDAEFGLTHYGLKTDWLNIERDHSHRLSRSRLLPEDLQVERGLNYLPTQDRILGQVNINTKLELAQAAAGVDPDRVLSIAVTRDRLLDNRAFRALAGAVRLGLDLYAMLEAQRRMEYALQVASKGSSAESYSDLRRTLLEVKPRIPAEVFSVLDRQVDKAEEAATAERNLFREERGLLGALATAGISAIAFEHEAKRQYKSLGNLVRRLRKDEHSSMLREEVAEELSVWISQAQETRAIFAPYLEPKDRQERIEMDARELVSDTIRQSHVYLQGIKCDLEGIPRKVRLPAGSYVEWYAVLQNILVNASNAMAGLRDKRISVSVVQNPKETTLRVQDNGEGVDLRSADELFKPFVRRTKIDQKRLAMGAGGTGMGLTIVKMLTEGLGVSARFALPDEGYSTCFELSWDA